MSNTINRRSFLGATLAAWPVSRLLASSLPIQHSQFTIFSQMDPVWFRFVITTYTNGEHSVTFNGKGHLYESNRNGRLKYVFIEGSTTACIEFLVHSPDTICVSYFQVFAPIE